MSITKDIKDTINLLKELDIYGCITGSSMLVNEADFDTWDQAPDIDVFVYYNNELLNTARMLIDSYGFEPATDGEAWKIDRMRKAIRQKDSFLQTLKLKKDDVIVNLTFKYGKTNMLAVLSSFDMSIIMLGYDIESKTMMDLRIGTPTLIPEDPNNKWSCNRKVAVPNPLRKQDVDMYGTEMWVRQFDRVIKYWNRGFDTRPMAQFYINLINGVIDKGRLFNSEKSMAAFDEFVSTYEPLRDKMVEWLKDKEDC